MPDVSYQLCESCGARFDERESSTECANCHGLLELMHPPRTDASSLRATFAQRRVATSGVEASGVWRYRELVVPSATDAEIVSHPEGNTPLLTREKIATWARVPGLLIKHEGHNPTGSFKDRGMTAAMTQAKRTGARAVACASTGNTSASLAAYAAHANIPALVFVPEGKVAAGKIAQTLAYGAKTLLVRGTFDTCLALAREASPALGIHLLNSVNPFRLEGQKTIVFELLEQLGWHAPDWIALPAGNLGNTSAFGKALREAYAIGLIDRLPRVAAIQASGAAPFAASFRDGFREHHTVEPETVASAIRIGAPASWDRAIRTIRETNGVVIDVTDDEILEAKRIIDTAGVGCEPASAASVAGAAKLRREGVIAEGDRVVAVLTGHLLKDPMTGLLNQPIEIEATVSAVDAVLRTASS
ncbi:MAG TPA: threonine synthase [Gemmatimonadaceae bacterium]|jgi:threonine synthase